MGPAAPERPPVLPGGPPGLAWACGLGHTTLAGGGQEQGEAGVRSQGRPGRLLNALTGASR